MSFWIPFRSCRSAVVLAHCSLTGSTSYAFRTTAAGHQKAKSQGRTRRDSSLGHGIWIHVILGLVLIWLLSVYIKADWKPRMMNVLWFMQQSCARFQRKGQAWSCLSNDEQCVCIFQRFSTYFDIFWFTGQLLVPQLHKLRWATECFSNEPLDPQWST